MVASTDSALIPTRKRPRAIGATQLLQTPSGTPVAAPISELSQRALVRRRRSVARKAKEEKAEGHPDAVGVEPIDGGAPNAGG